MKNNFSKLKRKIFLQVVGIAALATVIGCSIAWFFVDGLLQAPFANWFVAFCEKVLRLDFSGAQTAYRALFQVNKPIWLAVGFIILLLVFFYFGLTRFTRYFQEIGAGIDKLSQDSAEEISMSAEMDFMENKLNALKNTMEKRTKDAIDAEQRKNDLVVYLAHDIKTPLTSVVGYLSLLNEAPDMPPQQRAKYVGITLEKAYRLEQLIDEFFDITRFNLQTIVLDKELINLHLMLLQMADEFFPMLEPKGKKAVVHTEDGLIISGDADKLARVFNNILKNAIAYSYDNTTINIIAETVDKDICITFSNHGKAIPPQKLASVFEKFYRLDSARSTNTGGAGLGLAIAKEIVMAHGGSITATSSEEMTAFCVKLPKYK